MATDRIPDTFEGTTTKYEIFDGFRNLNTPLKIAYIAAAICSYATLPIAYEVFTYASVDQNRKRAEQYYRDHPQENPRNNATGGIARSGSLSPELNPSAPQDGRMADTVLKKIEQEAVQQR